MKRNEGTSGAAGLGIAVLMAGSVALAAEQAPSRFALDAGARPWSGFYIGAEGGLGEARIDSAFELQRADGDDLYGLGGGGRFGQHGSGALAGLFGGYNQRFGPLLLGLEASATAGGLFSVENSGAQPYANVTWDDTVGYAATAATRIPWMASLRPRLGLVLPNDWLLYVTGGPAIAKVRVEHTLIDNWGLLEQLKMDQVRSGHSLGAGLAVPLSERLALEAKYLYSDFGKVSRDSPESDIGDRFHNSQRLKTEAWLLGLSYRLGGATTADSPWPTPSPLAELTLESGFRLGLGRGRLGAPNPLMNWERARIGNILSSRLLYDDSRSRFGETFLRLDHSSGLFARVAFQASQVEDGNFYNEDFPLPNQGYSKTVSDIDGVRNGFDLLAGYNLLQAPGARLGAFVGYQRRQYFLRTLGLCQLASDTPCAEQPNRDDTNFVQWNGRLDAWQLGLDARLALSERVWLDTRAAWLPRAELRGHDDHLMRQFVSKDQARGSGASLEASLNYALSEAWGVGLGARYFSFRSDDGRSSTIDLLPGRDTPYPLKARFSDEQLDLFLQTTYVFGAGGQRQTPASQHRALDWSGFYLGGVLGGLRLRDDWKDPFPSTWSVRGDRRQYLNHAGFGNQVTSAGAMGGLRVGYDHHFGQWVAGVSAMLARTQVSGEDTCFSGLRGLNCQRDLDGIATLGGRLGWASGGSLFYGTAGAGLVNGKLGINGRSFQSYYDQRLDEKRERQLGWMAGAGVERRIGEHWSSYLEYNRIGGLSSDHQRYDAASEIRQQPLSTRSHLDLIMLGVNYRF